MSYELTDLLMSLAKFVSVVNLACLLHAVRENFLLPVCTA